MRVTLLQPTGARSCRDRDGNDGLGGRWVDADDFDRDGGARKRVADCVKGLHPTVVAHVFGELIQLLTAAREGRLSLWDDELRCGHVRRMTVRKRVLELRFNAQIDPQGGHRHIRLYFTEPAHESVLLALLLEWKADHPAGKAQQQMHIWEADRRIGGHYLARR